jgi:hypothetical protein
MGARVGTPRKKRRGPHDPGGLGRPGRGLFPIRMLLEPRKENRTRWRSPRPGGQKGVSLLPFNRCGAWEVSVSQSGEGLNVIISSYLRRLLQELAISPFPSPSGCGANLSPVGERYAAGRADGTADGLLPRDRLPSQHALDPSQFRGDPVQPGHACRTVSSPARRLHSHQAESPPLHGGERCAAARPGS